MAGISLNGLTRFAGTTPMSQLKQKYGPQNQPATNPAASNPVSQTRKPSAAVPNQNQIFNAGSGSL